MAVTTERKSAIKDLGQQGQSLWLDNLRRQLVISGELAQLRDEGVSGVTSNPTIFEKAISGSTDYDQALAHLVRSGRKPEKMLWDLMIEDIQAAAEVFWPVYDATDGRDGFVSIEVAPTIAHDTRRTIAMAEDLHRRCDRPNVMVKIPATREGLPAIRRMIGEGKNINVTLIFSVQRYAEVVEAYLSGLEDLQQHGGGLSRVASVASFFVSRVDTKVDKLLAARIEQTTGVAERHRLEDLYGKAAIANSKMAYQRYRQLFSGPRWQALELAGARPQRCLWASTSVKDPRYRDTMYVEELIGPNTVDTVPNSTLAAFQEHGRVRPSLIEDVDLAERQHRQLRELGIDLEQVTAELETEGVAAFTSSYEALLGVIKAAVKEVQASAGPHQWHHLGALQPAVNKALDRLDKEDVPRRLWAKDPTLWSTDPSKGQQIRDRLGWLCIAEQMLEQVDALHGVARESKDFSDVVLLGMGGSSLCPEVLRHTFRSARGYPRLHVLDTTDPTSILGLQARIKLKETLFLVSSKSGETVETLSHFAYFWDAVSVIAPHSAGRQFAAVTDPGTWLEQLAREHEFRWVFLAPPDIGGRYSALTYFGLVPGALLGIDVDTLLERGLEMMHACDACVPVVQSPGAWLGGILGQLAGMRRDKVTLVVSPKIATFGYWIEQLLAESTGKQGKGLIPIEGEPLGQPSTYGQDRVFVYVRLANDATHPGVEALEKAGQPVITLTLRDKLDLGGEFLRWEIATAIAGSMLGIDAFDQPNVQESKDNTRAVLAQFETTGRLPEVETVPVDQAAGAIRNLLRHPPRGAYLALMAYTARTTTADRALSRVRATVRDTRGIATTAGYGPRFLHSTGQLHKGGPPVGLFVQIVQDDMRDAAIPGQAYSFSILKQAQALGDFESLRSRGLPVVRVNVGSRIDAGWKALMEAVEAALR